MLFSIGFVPFAGAEQTPNVLFLAVDDMKDWVNCLGGYEGTVYTPNIDRLARRGGKLNYPWSKHMPYIRYHEASTFFVARGGQEDRFPNLREGDAATLPRGRKRFPMLRLGGSLSPSQLSAAALWESALPAQVDRVAREPPPEVLMTPANLSNGRITDDPLITLTSQNNDGVSFTAWAQQPTYGS